jgi:hypothetical protein
MSGTEHDHRWPHIAALLARTGGVITLGRIAPIEGAAVAADERTLFATLVRRDGESVHEFLQRLDEAIGAALHAGGVTNEINGGPFRLARPHTRKKR